MSWETKGQAQLLQNILSYFITPAITSSWIPEQDISARTFWAELIPQLHIIERLLDTDKSAYDPGPITIALEHLEQLLDAPSKRASLQAVKVCVYSYR